MTQPTARHQNVARRAARPLAVHPSATPRLRRIRRIGETQTPAERAAAFLAAPTAPEPEDRVALAFGAADAAIIARRARRAAAVAAGAAPAPQPEPYRLSRATLARIDWEAQTLRDGFCVLPQ